MTVKGIGFVSTLGKSELPTSTILLAPESKVQVHDNIKYKQMQQKSYYDAFARSANRYTERGCNVLFALSAYDVTDAKCCTQETGE